MSFLRRVRKRKPKPPDVLPVDSSLPPKSPTRDGYGFVVKPAFAEEYKSNVQMFVKEEEERKERWMAFLDRVGEGPVSPVGRQSMRTAREARDTQRAASHAQTVTTTSHSSVDQLEQILRGRSRGASGSDAPRRERELESLVRGGVPMALRGELWQLFLGVEGVRVEGVYEGLVKRARGEWKKETGNTTGKNTDDDNQGTRDSGRTAKPESRAVSKQIREQIAKDLPRTFPGHVVLDRPEMRLSLENVLLAYALNFPRVGYCQGMNFIVGVLLLLMEEEAVYWVLVQIIELILPKYFEHDMKTHLVDQEILRELACQKVPKVVSVLDDAGCPLHAVASSWFMALFANQLPWESALRVWDVALFEKTRAPLFQTALALLELDEMTVRGAAENNGGNVINGINGGVTKPKAHTTIYSQKHGNKHFHGGAFEAATTMASRAFDASLLLFHATCGHADVTISIIDALFEKHEKRMEREGFFDRGDRGGLKGDSKEDTVKHTATPTGKETRKTSEGSQSKHSVLSESSETVSEESSSSDDANDSWRSPGVPVPTTRARVISSETRSSYGQSKSSERRWRDVLARGAKGKQNETESSDTKLKELKDESNETTIEDGAKLRTLTLNTHTHTETQTSAALNAARVTISRLEHKLVTLNLKVAASEKREKELKGRLDEAQHLAEKNKIELVDCDAVIQRLMRDIHERDRLIANHDSDTVLKHKRAMEMSRQRVEKEVE